MVLSKAFTNSTNLIIGLVTLVYLFINFSPINLAFSIIIIVSVAFGSELIEMDRLMKVHKIEIRKLNEKVEIYKKLEEYNYRLNKLEKIK